MKVNEYKTKTGKPIRLWQGDCMELMEDKPENHWDLSIVDPPYGIDMANKFNKIKRWGGKDYTDELKSSDWDKEIPTQEYFVTLSDLSINQIIWGGNYFINYLYPTSCMISWNKSPNGTFTADCEIAWTSFDTKSTLVEMYNTIFGDNKYYEKRIHPTQKPTALYRWLLTNYATEGDRILDTHGGSMSLAIACYIEDFELDIIELDEDYYRDAVQRFEQHISQTTLF